MCSSESRIAACSRVLLAFETKSMSSRESRRGLDVGVDGVRLPFKFFVVVRDLKI